jgi:protein-disulfide isomerase
VLEQFPNDVNYVVKHFPLSNHRFAHRAAMAALAAGKQDKFWAFHSQLLENHKAINNEKIVEIAVGLGLNMDQFNQDRQAAASVQLIQADVANGKDVGVRGTPSLFMNGKRVKNPGGLPDLIRQELAR